MIKQIFFGLNQNTENTVWSKTLKGVHKVKNTHEECWSRHVNITDILGNEKNTQARGKRPTFSLSLQSEVSFVKNEVSIQT